MRTRSVTEHSSAGPPCLGIADAPARQMSIEALSMPSLAIASDKGLTSRLVRHDSLKGYGSGRGRTMFLFVRGLLVVLVERLVEVDENALLVHGCLVYGVRRHLARGKRGVRVVGFV